MTVVKRGQADRLVEDAIVLDLADLQRQADTIVSDAQAEAARILEDARTEATTLAAGTEERARVEGRAAGAAEGRAEGLEQGRAEARTEAAEAFAAVEAAFTRALDSFEADRRRLREQAREDVLRLALAIGGRVALRLPEIDPAVAADQVAEAIRLVGTATRLEVRIHPGDRPAVADALPGLLARFEASVDAALVDDPAVDRGGAIVRTPEGSVDARVRVQIDRIARALLPAEPPQDAGGAAPDAPVGARAVDGETAIPDVAATAAPERGADEAPTAPAGPLRLDDADAGTSGADAPAADEGVAAGGASGEPGAGDATGPPAAEGRDRADDATGAHDAADDRPDHPHRADAPARDDDAGDDAGDADRPPAP